MECSGPGVWVALLSNRRASPAEEPLPCPPRPQLLKTQPPPHEPLGNSCKPLAALMQTQGRMQVEVLGVLFGMPGEEG